MTKKEFITATKIALSDESLAQYDDSVLHGCALINFQPVVAHIKAIARFIRYHLY